MLKYIKLKKINVKSYVKLSKIFRKGRKFLKNLSEKINRN